MHFNYNRSDGGEKHFAAGIVYEMYLIRNKIVSIYDFHVSLLLLISFRYKIVY